MNILNNEEISKVNGGLILQANGTTLDINTSGIPDMCVTQFDEMFRDVIAASTSNPSYSSVMKIMAPHIDRTMASGCDNYMQLFNDRIKTATVRR
jgi:hypothetical protein